MAATEVLFHPEAGDEYTEAYEWYASRSLRAATAFEDEVTKALDTIAEAPERWALLARGCRRLVLDRFPYSIIYAVRGSWIWVVAVAHGSRRPDYWYHRVSEP